MKSDFLDSGFGPLICDTKSDTGQTFCNASSF